MEFFRQDVFSVRRCGYLAWNIGVHTLANRILVGTCLGLSSLPQGGIDVFNQGNQISRGLVSLMNLQTLSAIMGP